MRIVLGVIVLFFSFLRANAQTTEQLEFFESRIRPILAQECYGCHSVSTKREGNLVLDSRPGWQAGGDNGPIINSAAPKESLLLQAIKHERADLKMPKQGAKLDKRTIADFERWIVEGAIDPRDTPPTKDQFEKETSWPAILERRKDWWSLKPMAARSFGEMLSPAEFATEIDKMIEAEIDKHGLELAEPADPSTLMRRLSYTLIGLPPDDRHSANQKIYADLVDSLLRSPQFGEKWARHFMDWVRYAESYGSEGDPMIPYAWRYRDYLIRAFNEDVPWPQFVRESIAGDLLPNPRVRNGVNESAIGIGQLRMVLHGFSPVDSLDEQVTFTDNQIDTVTKAFQAFTVSCARCHNHKFDPISQADFYALYGIFSSTHPAVIDANASGTGEAIRWELESIKSDIKHRLVEVWRSQLPRESESVTTKPTLPTRDSAPRRDESEKAEPFHFHGLSRTPAGEFTIHSDTLRIHPGGYISNRYSQKDRAVLFSNRFLCDGGTLWFRVAGNGGVHAKYVVQNYPRTGTIHKAVELKDKKDEKLSWRKLSLDFWKGDEIFVQVSTAADLPAEYRPDAPSWFSVTDVQITRGENPPPNPEPSSASTRALVEAWHTNSLSDSDAEALDQLVQSKALTLESIEPQLKRYRELESKLPMPTRVPGVIEAEPKDAALFVRGDHKQPSSIVPRRYLEALDQRPFQTRTSGRLELAERIADMQANPLTARVIVNRLWHHVFGRGLVPTVDNFGKLGDLPSHPLLLDLLAQRFIDSGGSIKQLLRDIVLTKTFQRSSRATPSNANKDADNKLLAHFPMRRLEAEAIRDSILSLTGKLNPQMYGESTEGNLERRSVYVKIIRNQLDPFLSTFDAPVPFSTRGRRDVTNVPAQSLTLLNDPNVLRWSRDWATRVMADSSVEPSSPRRNTPEKVSQKEKSDRIRQMFREAFSREATQQELELSERFWQKTYEKALWQQRALHELEKKLANTDQSIDSIIAPIRKKLLVGKDRDFSTNQILPVPMSEWTFDKDGSDTFGVLPLTLSGNATIENGALLLDGKSMAESGSLPKRLDQKTLEVWVMLDNLKQQGGGVLTVQGKDGGLFDSIVYGEKQSQHWVAGSNFFERSESFEGTLETEADSRPIHIAVVYEPNGTIVGYREGKPYGRSYRKSAGAIFEPIASQVLLGCRHGKPSGNRGLVGRIFRARLYDRALTAEEVAWTSRTEQASIPDSEVIDALTESQRNEVIVLREQRAKLVNAWETARVDLSQDEPELQAWTGLSHSLINLKEFIYIR